MKPQELLKLRQSLGYSQRKFADFIGVRQNTIWRWESGNENMSHPWPGYIRMLIERHQAAAAPEAAGARKSA